jgi:hypothetical protein
LFDAIRVDPSFAAPRYHLGLLAASDEQRDEPRDDAIQVP